MTNFNHEYFMKQALMEAQKAFLKQEVPIGAIITIDSKIIAKAYNLTEQLNDVTAHAEIQVITAAAYYLGAKYLNNCTLYVTIEPCPMCAEALQLAQISRIVYGAKNIKRGYHKFSPSLLHNKTDVQTGILEKECALIVKKFFNHQR